MPLSSNGKLDRKALPEANFYKLTEQYVAPRNELETSIAAIWSQVLQLEKISVTDDFFSLGGHSILAIQLVHHLSKLLGREVQLLEVFEKKTIEAFCQLEQQRVAPKLNRLEF